MALISFPPYRWDTVQSIDKYCKDLGGRVAKVATVPLSSQGLRFYFIDTFTHGDIWTFHLKQPTRFEFNLKPDVIQNLEGSGGVDRPIRNTVILSAGDHFLPKFRFTLYDCYLTLYESLTIRCYGLRPEWHTPLSFLHLSWSASSDNIFVAQYGTVSIKNKDYVLTTTCTPLQDTPELIDTISAGVAELKTLGWIFEI